MKAVDEIITRKNAPFLVRLEPSLKEQVINCASHEGVSAAAFVRMAIRESLGNMPAAWRENKRKNGRKP